MKYFSTLMLALACTFSIAFAGSPRMTLIEEATNASCGPCANQNPYFQTWVNKNLDNVIPITYHYNYPGANDPMYLQDAEMNYNRITNYYGIYGVPTVRFNGNKYSNTSDYSTSEAPGTTDSLTSALNKVKGTTSIYTLVPTLTLNGSKYTASVDVTTDEAVSGKVLRIALVEYHVHYNAGVAGSNGETEFYWVTRKMMDTNGAAISQTAGQTKNYSYTFDSKTDWNASQLYLVAFVQDGGKPSDKPENDPHNVYQAATTFKGVLTASVSTVDQGSYIDKNGTFTTDVIVKNTSPIKATINLSGTISAVNNFPAWKFSFDQTKFELEPNATGTAKLTVNSNDTAYYATIYLRVDPSPSAGYNISDFGLSDITLLSSNAKDAFLYGMGQNDNANMITAIGSKFKNDIVYMPITSNFVTSSVDFTKYKKVIMTFGDATSNIIAGNSATYGTWPTTVYTIINTVIGSNTSLFIMSTLGASLTESVADETATDFYKNVLQITDVAAKQRYSGNNLNTFTLKGVSNDEIGDGVSATFNNGYSSTWPYYILNTDLLTTTENSEAKECMYYDGKEANGAGYYIKHDNSKIAYLSFDFGGISTSATRVKIFNNVMTWLEPDAAIVPQITVAKDTISFGKVKVGDSKELPIIITNAGLAALTIKADTDISDDPDGSFSLKGFTNDVTIAPNTSYTLTVAFSPKSSTQNYNDTKLYISSNDNTTPSYTVYLQGSGSATEITDPQININIASINFGSVTIGKDSTISFDVSNTGKADLKISTATINTSIFSVVDFPSAGLTIPQASKNTIKVKFVPAVTGDFSAKLTLLTNDPTQNYVKIPLVGSAVPVNSVDYTLGSNNLITLNVAPNPINDNSTISYSINSNNQEFVKLSIVDISGKVISDVFSGYANAGLNTVKFDATNIPSGKYFLIANIKNTSVQFPIVISK